RGRSPGPHPATGDRFVAALRGRWWADSIPSSGMWLPAFGGNGGLASARGAGHWSEPRAYIVGVPALRMLPKAEVDRILREKFGQRVEAAGFSPAERRWSWVRTGKDP